MDGALVMSVNPSTLIARKPTTVSGPGKKMCTYFCHFRIIPQKAPSRQAGIIKLYHYSHLIFFNSKSNIQHPKFPLFSPSSFNLQASGFLLTPILNPLCNANLTNSFLLRSPLIQRSSVSSSWSPPVLSLDISS